MSLIARVIPAVGLPRSFSFFDYAIPKRLANDLHPGVIVRIPFRSRAIFGLVDSLTSGDASALKTIIEVPTSFCLSESDRSVIDWISCSARVSPALVFSRMASYIPLLRGEGASYAQSRGGVETLQPILVRTATLSERDAILSDALTTASSREGVAFLLCPTVREAERMTHALIAQFGTEQIVSITSATRTTALRAVLARIADGGIRIVIGTRVLLGVPLGSRPLTAVILSDASRDEYKQTDLNPRYDGRGLAVARAKAARASCIFLTSAPRLEERLAVRDGIFQQSAPRVLRAAPWTVANLEDAMRGGRYDFLTDELEEAITSTLAQSESVFLFLNRKGSSRLVTCKDCEHIFACSQCRHPYSFFKKDSTLRCPGGHHTLPLPTRCPSCRGTRFAFRGFGIENLCDSLAMLFPDVNILEYSRETRAGTQGSKSGTQITVGTSLVPIERPDIIRTAGLVGIVAGDPIINPHDFRSVEHQWRQVAHILSFVERNNSRTIIQAFRPNDPFIMSLARGDYDTFADSLMREREEFFWPPFSRLVTIIVKKVDAREQETLSQLDALKKQLLDLGPTISVFPPIREKNQIRMTVRITGARVYVEPFPSCLATIFSSLPSNWLVDTDPLSL